ncbi:M1 family aminopeptidase [Chitinophaga niabensis]|uniref:Peptidase family M1 n=1 Tax=Chitinophaga niabensis TaxID=536979 RepID=A0A1N6DQU3_9BACT|nr:M1 family aminopeptidase [Chitinophaga niabensis]SIN73162.1 Peptidase family M1 [Chitinophaga niabensis]
MLILFEWTYQYKKKLFLFAILFFSVLGFAITQANIGPAEVWNNGPYAIHFILCFVSITALFAMTILCASAVLRDSEYRMQEIIYATGITKQAYLVTRFSGLMIAGLCILLASIAGMIAGGMVKPGGPVQLLYYFQAFCLIGVPNVLFSAASLFLIANLFRSTASVYAGGILLYILYFVASLAGNSPLMAGSSPTGTEHALLYALADPFGFVPFLAQTKGWTEDEMNTLTIVPDLHFTANRICWILVSLLLLTLTYFRFSFASFTASGKEKKQIAAAAPGIPYAPVVLSAGNRKAVLLESWRLGTKSVLKSLPFLIMVLLWLFMMGMEFYQTILQGMFGMRFIPYSGEIAARLRDTHLLELLLLYYAAEISWREKQAGMQDLIDATAAPRRVLFFSKCLTMITMAGLLVTVNIAAAVIMQTTVGYTDYALGTYLSLYYYSGVPMAIFGILFLVIQRHVPNKYIGMVLSAFVLYLLLEGDNFGLKHPLWHFAAPFKMKYDALNGWGHYKTAFHWYMLMGVCIALLAAGVWRYITGIAALLVAGYIFYQTPSSDDNWGNVYREKYMRYSTLPQPVITSVKTAVELYPAEKRYTVKGTYHLLNNTAAPIPEILTGITPGVSSINISIPGATLLENDDHYKFRRFRLQRVLQPGDSIELSFSLAASTSAFTPYNPENSVQENSAYIELEKNIPYIGYAPSLGLTKEYDTEPDDSALHYSWVHYETTIGTAIDQTALTVGTLEKQWEQNGRKYFHYKTEGPIAFMFALASGKYQQQQVNGVEIYYYHGQNVPVILTAARQSLATYNRIFGPYQYKTLRIVEIPHYPGAGTAYPGIVFLKENFIFGTDLKKMDYATSVTAHEIAHQWWAYQVEPLGIAGSKVLTETLANYAEAIITEQLQGKDWLTKYHLVEHNIYISSRANKETTLKESRTESYVHYQKGSIVMQAMMAEMGSDTINAALRGLLKAHSWPGTRPATADLLSNFYAVATPSQRQLIHRWWETKFLYDLSLEEAGMKKLPSGEYEVKLQVKSNAPEERLGIALYDDTGKMVYKGYQTRIVLKEKPALAVVDPDILRLEKNREDNVKKIE